MAEVAADRHAELQAMSDFLDGQLTIEYQAKSSFETRAGFVITACLGIATLFLALRLQFNLSGSLATGAAHWMVPLSLVLLAVAIVACAASAVPWLYEEPDPADLTALAEEIDTADGADRVLETVVFAKVSQFRAASAANDVKSKLQLVAFTAMGVAVFLLVVVLLTAKTAGVVPAP